MEQNLPSVCLGDDHDYLLEPRMPWTPCIWQTLPEQHRTPKETSSCVSSPGCSTSHRRPRRRSSVSKPIDQGHSEDTFKPEIESWYFADQTPYWLTGANGEARESLLQRRAPLQSMSSWSAASTSVHQSNCDLYHLRNDR